MRYYEDDYEAYEARQERLDELADLAYDTAKDDYALIQTELEALSCIDRYPSLSRFLPKQYRYLLNKDIYTIVELKYAYTNQDDTYGRAKFDRVINSLISKLRLLEPEKYDLFESDHTTGESRLILVADTEYEALLIQSRFVTFNANDDTKSYTIRKRNS